MIDGNLAMNSHFENMSEEDNNAMLDHHIGKEKRREAIAFAEWAAANGWLLSPDCYEDEEQGWYKPSDDFNIPDERLYGGQLYDLYLQSLTPKIDNNDK